MNRVCYECAFMYANEGWAGTDVTPGEAFTMGCQKDHWFFSESRASVKTIREFLETAQTCPDFTERSLEQP